MCLPHKSQLLYLTLRPDPMGVPHKDFSVMSQYTQRFTLCYNFKQVTFTSLSVQSQKVRKPKLRKQVLSIKLNVNLSEPTQQILLQIRLIKILKTLNRYRN